MFAYANTTLLSLFLLFHVKYSNAGWTLKELEAVEKILTKKDTDAMKVEQCLLKIDYTSVIAGNDQGFAVQKHVFPKDFDEKFSSVFLYGNGLDTKPNTSQRIHNQFKSVLFLKTINEVDSDTLIGDPRLTFSNGNISEDVNVEGFIATAARPMGNSAKYVMVDIGKDNLWKFLDDNNDCTITSQEGVAFKIADVSQDAGEKEGKKGAMLAKEKTYILLTPIDNPNPRASVV